jgi:hypothetical protein
VKLKSMSRRGNKAEEEHQIGAKEVDGSVK